MKSIFLLSLPGLALALLIGGCGGGGGDSASPTAPPAIPVSGTYGWLLKASGGDTASKRGLSLVHPSRSDTEFVIEAQAEVVTDARLVSRGTVDAAAQRVSGLQADSLLYIIGGDVRRVPLTANGSAPQSRVQRAQSSNACAFVIAANDFAAPQNSRFVVSTAGPDGQCGSADDGRAELRLTASGPLDYSALAGELPLGFVRDTATLAPRGWIYPRSLVAWGPPSASTLTRGAPALPLTAVLASAPNASLVSDGTRLSVLFYIGNSVPEVALDAATTAGSGWQTIGFDASAFYLYINPGAAAASGWRIVKVTRDSPRATVLASGTGQVVFSSMGRDMLYLSVLAATENQLVRVAKVGGAPVVARGPVSALTTVTTGASGVHQRLRASGLGTSALSYSVDMVDESDATLFSLPGGLPLAIAESAVFNLNASESRTQFLLADNFGARGFGDAAVIAYDSASRTFRNLGALPGRTDYGNDNVFAQLSAGPATQGLGFAARVSGDAVQSAGSKVFSFDLATAGSLRYTSRTE